MGLEGGSNNNEVQIQEINQASNQQIEQNQAEHQRSGEQLEANSTIDNEGERKQIEGKEESTESDDNESSKLDDDDEIKDDPQEQQPQEDVQQLNEQSQLDNDNTIENNASGAEDIGPEPDNEITDSLDDDSSIEDTSDADDDNDSEELEKDSLDNDSDISSSDDGVEMDDDNNEHDSLDNDDKIESDDKPEDDELDNKPESDESDNKPEDEGTDNKPEGDESDNKPEGDESDNKPEGEGTDNKPEGDESDNKPEGDESDNKPEGEGTDNKPEGDESDNKPESEDTDNKPEGEDTDNKPEGDDADDKPEGDESDNKPEGDESDNKPEGDESDNKPEDEGTDNKPEGDESDNKPEGDESDNKPEGEGTDNKPEGDESDNKPESEDTDNKPEGEDTDNKPEGDESDNKPEGEDTDNKPEGEDTDNKSEGEDTDNKPEGNKSEDKPNNEGTDSNPEDGESGDKPNNEGTDGNPEGNESVNKPEGGESDNNPNGETSGETNPENNESNGEAPEKPTKLEDITWEQAMDMMKTPEGKAELMRLNADFRERYEAEMWGMTQEEYQDYKAACAQYEKEKEEKEKNGIELTSESSEAESKADKLLAEFKDRDKKSKDAYMMGASAKELDMLSDQNSSFIKELKDSRAKIKDEIESTWEKLAAMNHDGTKGSNPSKYRELCDKYNSLEKMDKDLDYAITKMDMNNYDISTVRGNEYRNEAKDFDKKDIDKTMASADKILKEGVSDNKSIMDAYKVGEKLEHDVIPSLFGEGRELESRIKAAESKQEAYCKEHNCTPEEAMKKSDGIYAQTENYKNSLIKEKTEVDNKFSEAVEKSTALHDQVPIAGSDCTLKVIDNKNGTVSVERSWDNGGAHKSEHKGRFHNSETSLYMNAVDRKSSITIGETSGNVYAKQFSFQYRGLGFKREGTIGGENTKLKNVAEGGLGNFNFTVGYKQGLDGKASTLSASARASIAELKNTTSLVKKDKEYKAFSAEVSLLKCSGDAKVDSKGNASISGSAHIAGAEAKASVGGVTVAKASVGIGEVKASASTNILEDPSASVTGKKASASIGNNLTLAKAEPDDNGGIKTSTVIDTVKKDVTSFVDGLKDGDININKSTINSVVKDINAVKDIKDGKLGTDISKKPEDVAIGNVGIKETKISDKPADFEAKIVEHSDLSERIGETREFAQDLKTSLEPFAQSKWDNMSFEERAEAIDKLADSVADDLGLENRPDVKYYQSDNPGDFGGYSASENAIYINANNMGDAAETADTIAHESRHCWQHEYAEKSDSPLAQEFRENFDDYVRPEDDYREYKNQPVEQDARNYADEITSNINHHPESEITTADGVDSSNNSASEIRESTEEKGAVFEVKTAIPSDVENKTVDFESKLKSPEEYSTSFEYKVQNSLEQYYKADGGRLTNEQKENLASELKSYYDTAPDTKDVTVPESPKDVTGIYYDKINNRYDVAYDWKDVDTVPETRTMKVLKEGEQFDRVGYPSGRCVGEVNADGSCSTAKQRSTPYHFTKENISDEPSYHRYEALQDFTRDNIEKAIDNSSLYTDEQKAGMHKQVDDYYNKKHEKYGDGDGLAYGEIAPMFEDTTGSTGGGHQYDMPLNMEQLYNIGMIDEIPRSEFK